MNVRSSIVLTVKEIEAAIRELQQQGAVAIADVVVTVSNGASVIPNEPGEDTAIRAATLASSVTVTIPSCRSS